MSQTAMEATPAHLLQRAVAPADVGRSCSGADPSPKSPQSQAPDTLLLNAHQMCTHKRRAAQAAAAHSSSHSLVTARPTPSTPVLHAPRHRPHTPTLRTAEQARETAHSRGEELPGLQRERGGTGGRDWPPAWAPGRGSTRRLGAMLALSGGRSG
jgi:hypothetical protein